MGKNNKTADEVLPYQGPTDPAAAHSRRARSVALFALVLVTDFACVLGLYLLIHGASAFPGPGWRALLHALRDFGHDVADLVLLTLLRIAVLVVLAQVAGREAWREAQDQQKCSGGGGKPAGAAAAAPRGRELGAAPVANGVSGNSGNGGLREPLLVKDRLSMSRTEREKMAEEASFTEWFSSVSSKDLTLFASFLLCTVFQVSSATQS
eukprot:SM002195S07119  [mRNA]  locus=s2195:180:1204:- [translate_table: standard]